MNGIGLRIEDLVEEAKPFVQHPGVFPINDRGTNPLAEGSVGFAEQSQGLPELPTREVDRVFVDSRFKVLKRLNDGEVAFRRSPIHESHVVVAVFRRETPCPATGLDRKENPKATLRFELR